MNLITDRKQDAIYEYTDLNRVESAVSEISTMLLELGFADNLKTKTNWKMPDIFSIEQWPVESQMFRYLSNVERIKTIFPNSITLPESMSDLTWIGANNIEKVLQIAFERINSMKSIYRYSGEFFAGEEKI